MERKQSARLSRKGVSFQKKFLADSNRFIHVDCGYFGGMVISIGCDHAGPELKSLILNHLETKGHTLVNRGTDGLESVDYPDHAHAVADDVASGHAELGILICGSANGVAMTANKHAEVRAALAWTSEVAALGRQHNNANILCIPARFVSEDVALEMVDAFFDSEFEGGRHERRVGKIACAMSVLFAAVTGAWAQSFDVSQIQLDERELSIQLNILASDGFEGRETGERGQKKAAAYLEAYYESKGFEPCNNGSFFQNVPLVNNQISGGTLRVGEDTLSLVEDFLVYPGLEHPQVSEAKLTFVGHGVVQENWNDYKKFKGEGMVVMLDGEPEGMAEQPLSMKRMVADSLGAQGIIVAMPDEAYETRKSRMKKWMLRKSTSLNREKEGEGTDLPTLFITQSTLNLWLAETKLKSTQNHAAKLASGKPTKALGFKRNANLDILQTTREYEAENVLAFLEGSDQELKEEVVVITSHYDHVGVIDGEIHNGADDDGSGTVTVMEIARQFKMLEDVHGIRPRRSVLFMNVVGEEKGLLGSEYYADHPVFPLENTVANLNIDMIGRTDAEHPEDPRYVYLIGSDKLSSELHVISEDANKTFTNLVLDYTYNAPDDPNRFYYRSDHYNFAKNNIPVIFYFTGVHEDYHKPGDDAHKIMYPKMAEIGELVFHTAWELANRDARIVVDQVNDFSTDR